MGNPYTVARGNNGGNKLIGWAFVGMVLLSILAFSMLSIARDMKKWGRVIEEQGKHLEALNQVDSVHHLHLTQLGKEVFKTDEQ